MSAVTVIAAALDCIPAADPRPTAVVNLDRAAAAVRALKDAGYAVVELPKPDEGGPDADGQVYFDEYTVRADPTGAKQYRRVITDFGLGTGFRTDFSPSRARHLAAALLAAANAAEATNA